MSCNQPGSTHHLACDCREAQWAERLAAAEARALCLEGERDAWEKSCVIAEARVAKLEESLREIAGHECQLVRDKLFRPPGDCSHVNERHPVGSCGSCVARAALAPLAPGEGGSDGR